jgi:hypothetical protein
MSQSGQEGTSGTTGTDGAQTGAGGSGTESQDNTNGASGTGADGAQQNSGTSTEQETVAKSDFERTRAQLAEADRKREAAEQELKTLKQKDLSELEKAKTEAEEATAKLTQLETENQKLKLANAFLASNTITWQNGEVALDIAASKGYLDDVADDKGVVDSKKLVAALTKLSQDHKYLVKAADDDEGEQQGGSSGSSATGRKNNATDDKVKQARLEKNFPALGRR